MANRKLPFGYEMRLGIIRINAAEAPIVKEIYTAYSEGMSYLSIKDMEQLIRTISNVKRKPAQRA